MSSSARILRWLLLLFRHRHRHRRNVCFFFIFFFFFTSPPKSAKHREVRAKMKSDSCISLEQVKKNKSVFRLLLAHAQLLHRIVFVARTENWQHVITLVYRFASLNAAFSEIYRHSRSTEDIFKRIRGKRSERSTKFN